MTHTEWTPEARKIREAERAAARFAMRSTSCDFDSVEQRLDRMFPPPPPEYTYGREIAPPGGNPFHMVRVRSDGIIEGYDCAQGRWRASPSTKAYIRDLCSEFPLTDAECDELLSIRLTLLRSYADTRDAMRSAFVRVMRREAKP